MKSLNQVQLIGCLGQDPEMLNQEGTRRAKFSIATNDNWLDKKTNEKRTLTEWHRVVCFNQLADIVNKHLKKGAKVYLSGRLKTSKWQDKQQETHYTTEIIAEELIMLDGKNVKEIDEQNSSDK